MQEISSQTALVLTQILSKRQISKLPSTNNSNIRVNFSPNSYKNFVTDLYTSARINEEKVESEPNNNNTKDFFHITPVLKLDLQRITYLLSTLPKSEKIIIFTDGSMIKN